MAGDGLAGLQPVQKVVLRVVGVALCQGGTADRVCCHARTKAALHRLQRSQGAVLESRSGSIKRQFGRSKSHLILAMFKSRKMAGRIPHPFYTAESAPSGGFSRTATEV